MRHFNTRNAVVVLMLLATTSFGQTPATKTATSAAVLRLEARVAELEKRLARIEDRLASLTEITPVQHGSTAPDAGPGTAKVTKDLVGHSFEIEGRRFDIAVVRDLVIQERSTDKDARTEELRALVTVSGGGGYTARGILLIRYKHFEQGWKIQSVAAQNRFSYL